MISPQEVLRQPDAAPDSVSSKHSPIEELLSPENIKIQDCVQGKQGKLEENIRSGNSPCDRDIISKAYIFQIYCRLGLFLARQIKKIINVKFSKEITEIGVSRLFIRSMQFFSWNK